MTLLTLIHYFFTLMLIFSPFVFPFKTWHIIYLFLCILTILQWLILGGCFLTAIDKNFKHEKKHEYNIDILKKFNIDSSEWNGIYHELVSYLAILPGITYAIYKLNTNKI